MGFQSALENPNVQRQVNSPAFQKYMNSLETMARGTQRTYRARLYPFVDYVDKVLKTTIDKLLADIKAEKYDPYDVLSAYLSYAKKELQLSDHFLRDLLVTTRAFLEFHRIYFNDRQLRAVVRMPRPVRRDKEPIDKNDVVTILQAIHDPSLHLYTLMLAATGMRATEALSLRLRNLALDSDPGKIYIEGEYTKTRTDRFVFVTAELKKNIQAYLKQKYAPKTMRLRDPKTGIRKRTQHQVKQSPDDLLFAPYDKATKRDPNLNTMYISACRKLGRVIDGFGTWKRERHSGFREVTRHTFRRFVKSTISDLGYADFSEWYIGHIASTYYRKKENERVEIFRKIEPYLTFLDISRMEARGADQQTQLEQSQQTIRIMQEQMALMMAYTLEPDPQKKAELSRNLIEKGYMPKTS